MGTELKQCREKLVKVHSASSLGEMEEQVRNKGKSEATPSTGISTKPTGGPTRYAAPHNGTSTEPRGEPTSYAVLPRTYEEMNYAEATQGMKYRTYRTTVKSTGAYQPEEIKNP